MADSVVGDPDGVYDGIIDEVGTGVTEGEPVGGLVGFWEPVGDCEGESVGCMDSVGKKDGT